jgi:hypothetical protein
MKALKLVFDGDEEYERIEGRQLKPAEAPSGGREAPIYRQSWSSNGPSIIHAFV